jgi:hypothetical protein
LARAAENDSLLFCCCGGGLFLLQIHLLNEKSILFLNITLLGNLPAGHCVLELIEEFICSSTCLLRKKI